jgi:hypothetical protein
MDLHFDAQSLCIFFSPMMNLLPKIVQEKRRNSCGFGPIAFIATIQSLESIPQSLSSSGLLLLHECYNKI